MSRAFIKEDAGDDHLPERHQPSGPNYVTPRGLELLKEKVSSLETACAGKAPEEQRDLRYWRLRLATAVLVENSKRPPEDIRFGAFIEARDAGGKPLSFHIVGQDEAEEGGDKISWDSAAARALMGLRAGQRADWDDGEARFEAHIVSLRYAER